MLVLTLILTLTTAGIETASAQESTPQPTGTPTATATATSTTSSSTSTATTRSPATATATTTPEEDAVVATIGPTVRVTSAEYRDGAFRLVLEADVPVLLTAIEGIQTGGARGTSAGNIEFRRKSLSPGKNELVVEAPLTDGSATVVLSANGHAAYVSHNKGGSLLSGPYTAADVRDSGIGAASGLSIAVLIGAIRAKLGGRRKGERIA